MTPQVLDSRQLLAFVTLAQTGSFTETARQLSLTQSAISHSIKALEKDLGCELCHRLGKKIHLTASGRTLLYMAEEVLRQMAQVRSVLDRENEWGGGQIRIGAGPTVCQFLLPSALREFKESFPRCQVVLETADTPELLQDLELNRIDLAFVLEPRASFAHVFYPLFSDELAFIVPPGHPWALAGRAPKAEIAEESMLLYSRASYSFRMISRYFREEGMELRSTFELKNTEVLKQMVKISMGVAIMAPWVALDELREGTLVSVPLGRRKLKRTWGVACLKGRKLSLVEETFLGIVTTVCRNMAMRDHGITPHGSTTRGGNEKAPP